MSLVEPEVKLNILENSDISHYGCPNIPYPHTFCGLEIDCPMEDTVGVDCVVCVEIHENTRYSAYCPVTGFLCPDSCFEPL